VPGPTPPVTPPPVPGPLPPVPGPTPPVTLPPVPVPPPPVPPVLPPTHALFWHVCPPVHIRPQLPQLAESEVRFAQLLPHAVEPVGQVVPHLP